MTVGPLLTAAVGAWESTGVVYSNLSRNRAPVSGLEPARSNVGAAFCPAFCLGLRGRLADERSFELRGKADLGRGYNQRGPYLGPTNGVG